MGVSVYSEVPDLMLVYEGGQSFEARMREFTQGKASLDKALEELNLGRSAGVAYEDALAKQKEATKALDDAKAKSSAMIEEAKQQAANVLKEAHASADALNEKSRAERDQVAQEVADARAQIVAMSENAKAEAVALKEQADQAKVEAVSIKKELREASIAKSKANVMVQDLEEKSKLVEDALQKIKDALGK